MSIVIFSGRVVCMGCDMVRWDFWAPGELPIRCRFCHQYLATPMDYPYEEEVEHGDQTS